MGKYIIISKMKILNSRMLWAGHVVRFPT